MEHVCNLQVDIHAHATLDTPARTVIQVRTSNTHFTKHFIKHLNEYFLSEDSDEMQHVQWDNGLRLVWNIGGSFGI